MQIIDKIDKYIVEKLVSDGRMSFANIAKDINLTDVAIKKRLDRLKARGIIKNISAEIDYEVVGFNEMIELLIAIDPAKQENIIKKLGDLEDVIEVHEVTGEYNFMAKLIAVDKPNLKDLLDVIFAIDGIIKISILTILKEHKNKRNLPSKIIQTTF
jgi:DNA-binding Lrp family transcriptional regulator